MKVIVYGDRLDLADELREEFAEPAKLAVGEAGDLLLAVVQRKMRMRKGPAAAPPGEPPAEQSGELAASYKRIAPRVRGAVATSGIYSRHPGAARVEYGATDSRGIRTFPHPAVRQAEAEMEPRIDELLQRRMNESPLENLP